MERTKKNAARSGADTPCVAANERIYAIGDVHGRYDLLLSLLVRIYQDANMFHDDRKIRLVFLGDYVDRGDDSRKVLEALFDLKKVKGSRINCLLGNHESALLKFLDDPVKGKDWLGFGGAQTLASYKVKTTSQEPGRKELLRIRDGLGSEMGNHVAFLRSLETHLRSGDVIFTHAGVNPKSKDPSDDTRAMLWGHPEFLTDWPIPDMLVVHGHFDTAGAACRPGRICVDSGAYYSGELSAVRLDDSAKIISTNSPMIDQKDGAVYTKDLLC